MASIMVLILSTKDSNPTPKISEKIQEEILNGNYIEVDKKHFIVSPLGVIPKFHVWVRLIHDCSRSKGIAVSDYVGHLNKQRFQPVESSTGI